MESDGDHFLAFYLTKEDEAATAFKTERLARSPNAPEEDNVRLFHLRNSYLPQSDVFRCLANSVPLCARL